MKTTLAAALTSAIDSYKQCAKTGNHYGENWAQKIRNYHDFLPSGSGIDNGCLIDIDNSTSTKLLIKTNFHHMDGNGFYTKWTSHRIVITPTFEGINVAVTNDKDGYISELFHNAMMQLVDR